MPRKLRRYRFQGVPRLTRAQVHLTNALLSRLPQTPFEADFKTRLREVIEPLVRVDVDFWFDHVTALAADELWSHLSHPLCVAVVALQPRPYQALLEVDLTLAQQAIDRLLGGEAEDFDGQRPLSDIEEGIFSYLLLRVLKLVQSSFGDEHQVALKLSGVVGSKEALESRARLDHDWVMVGFKLFFDAEVAFARLYLPAEFVHGTWPRVHPLPGPALSRAIRRTQQLLPRIGELRVPLQVEVGRVPFTLEDLQGIEPGDIVLIEDTQLRLSEGALAGPLQCRIAGGREGCLEGELVVGESGNYEVVLQRILPGGTPDEAPGNEEEYAVKLSHAAHDGAALAATLRETAAARAAASPPSSRLAGLRAAPVDDEVAEGEHSSGGYDDGYDEGEYPEEGYEEGEEEALPESAALLREVAVSMVVELGRVRVSASDIVGLRPGQVVELTRAPGDPVDLVVDGRRIGRGEVVDIEGELGVRILDLVNG